MNWRNLQQHFHSIVRLLVIGWMAPAWEANAIQVNWDGGGDGTNWSDPLNWDSGQMPSAEDDVIIAAGPDSAVIIDGSIVEIRSLTTTSQVSIDVFSLTATSFIHFDDDLAFLTNGHVSSPDIRAKDAVFVYDGGRLLNDVLVDDGEVVFGAGIDPATFILHGNSYLGGRIPAGVTVVLQGGSAGGHAVVGVDEYLENEGTLVMESVGSNIYRSSLQAGEFPVSNLPGGVILIRNGIGGPRLINAALSNEGQVVIEDGQLLEFTGFMLQTGNLELGIQSSLEIGGSLYNEGSTTLGMDAVLEVDMLGEGSFTQSTGSLTANAGGSVSFDRGNFSWEGGALPSSVTIQDSDANVGFDAVQPVEFQLRGDVSWFGEIAPGQTLWIQGGGGSRREHAVLTFAGSAKNSGTIRLESVSSSVYRSSVFSEFSMLENTPDGSIIASKGTGGALAMSMDLLNHGAFHIDPDTSFTFNGRFTNQQNANAVLESGADVDFNGTFVQQGIFDIQAQAVVTIDLDADGLFEQLGGSTTIAPDAALRIKDGGVNLMNGDFGSRVLLEDVNIFLALDLVSPCEFVCLGESTFRGNPIVGQVLHVTGRSAEGSAVLDILEPLNNSGLIILDTESGDIWTTTLNAQEGLFNLSDGTFAVSIGSGGRTFFNGQLINEGNLSIQDGSRFELTGDMTNFGQSWIGDNISFNLFGSLWNEGEFLGGESTVLRIQSDEEGGFAHSGGEFLLGASTSLLVNGGQFNLFDGEFTGEAIVTDVSLTIGPEMVSPFSLILQGECYFDGDIAPGQSIWIRGTGSIPGITGGTSTVMNAARSFTNAGLLRLESINGGIWESSLFMGDELLFNSEGGVLEINYGEGGERVVTGNVVNEGLLEFGGTDDLSSDEAVIEPQILGTLSNSGILNVGNRVAVAQIGVFFNEGMATFGEDSVFVVTGGDEAGIVVTGGEISLGESSALAVVGANISLLGGSIDGFVLVISAHLELSSDLAGGTILIFQGQNTFLGNLDADKAMYIQGGGQYTGHSVLVTEGGFINEGTIIMETVGSTLFRASLIVLDGVFENRGSIAAFAGTGGPKSILAELQNFGEMGVEGRFTLGQAGADHINFGTVEFITADVTVFGNSFVNETSGYFGGYGTVDLRPGGLLNHGTVSPGESPGELTLLGPYVQTESGVLDIELSGVAAGTGFDVLNIDGTANFAGTLNLSLGEGFIPTLGDVFPVLRYAEKNGSFSTVNGLEIGLGEQPFLDLFYRAKEMSIYAVESALIPPKITTNPLGGNLQLAGLATLTVEAQGTAPLRYQWRRNGVKLEGQTSDRLSISGSDRFAAGDYQVIVYNDFGSVISPTASIQVDGPGVAPVQMADIWGQQPDFRFSQFRISSDNSGASHDPGEPAHDGKPGGASVWLTWTPDENGVATFETTGSAFDTILAVYAGDSIETLNLITSNDDGSSSLTSIVKFNAVAGTPYHVVVDGYSGQQGRINLIWNLDSTLVPAPVITSEPVDIVAALDGSATYVVIAEGGNLSYQWYFNGEAIAGAVNDAWTVSSVQPLNLGVYEVVVSNAVGDEARSRKARLEAGTNTAARTSWKLQELLDSLTGIQIASDKRPDSFTSVSAGAVGSQIFDTFGATTEPGEPAHGGAIGGASVWFGITAETDGVLRIDTAGSDTDTLLAVYVGSGLLDLQLIAEDDNGGADGVTSRVQFSAIQGAEYLVAVDSVDGVTGNINLNWQLGTLPEISLQPTSQVIQKGQAFALLVEVSGHPAPSIQWQLNGLDIEGANSPGFSIDEAIEDDFGRYSVVLENFVGIAVSDEAQIGPTIQAPSVELRITRFSFVGGFQCSVAGPDGKTVAIDASDDLKVWTDIFTGQITDGGVSYTDPDSTTKPHRYYRARLIP